MNLLFILPVILSSVGALSPLTEDFSVIKMVNGSEVSTEQIVQFSLDDYDLIGQSNSAVCSNDIGINDYSCVSGDLDGLGINKLVYGLSVFEDKIITFADDYISKKAYVYLYRVDVNKIYSRISISTRLDDYYNYDFVNDVDDSTTDFNDYDLRLISMSDNYHFVKYEIELSDMDDSFWSNQRNYVVRELISFDNEILPVAIQYSCTNNADVLQNELKYFTAEQYIFDNWFYPGTDFTATDYLLAYFGGIWGILPFQKFRETDHTVIQQSIMLFNLKDEQVNFVEKNLRAIKMIYSSYQMSGYISNFTSSAWNSNQGKDFIERMPLNWKASESSFQHLYDYIDIQNNHHLHWRKRNNQRIGQTAVRKADDKYSIDINSGFFFNKKYTYEWNGLGTTTEFLNNTKKILNTDYESMIKEYNYYTVLNTQSMDISYYLWNEPYGFGTNDYEVDIKNLPDENGNYRLPTYFYDVSLTEFWYEENGEIHKGIIVANYDATNGAVNLFNIEQDSNLKLIVLIVIAVLAFFLLSIILNLLGILKPVGMLLVIIFKGLIYGIVWVVKLPYTIIKAIVNRGQG